MNNTQKILHTLKEKGVSMYRVSKDTGFSQGLLSHWKSGHYEPTKDGNMNKLVDYAQKYGVDAYGNT